MADLLPVTIGIVGCADIARKVSRAIQLAPNATVSAVASRSLEKATKFARVNTLPPETKIYGSYEALLDDPDVDAVYMPLPTSLHRSWGVRVAEKKKHLLLEKPVAMNVAEFDDIVAACDANGVQVMDGTMSMHHPRAHKMKEFYMDTERFGKLQMMNSCFTFRADPNYLKNNIRVKPDLDGLGALGDIGWYNIRNILFATDFELPKTVAAMPGPVLNDAGVILSCGAILHWEDGKVATFYCSFLSNLTTTITAIGTKGTLHITDFNIPYEEGQASFTESVMDKFNELHTGWATRPREEIVSTDIPQEVAMVKEFCRLVGDIKRYGAKPDKKWAAISRKNQLVLDAVKVSIENGFQVVEIVG